MAYNNYFPAGYQPAYYPTQSNAYPTQMNVGATQPTQNGIQHTDQGDILGASPRLATIDTVFTGRKRTHALQAALHTLKQRYDHIFIDPKAPLTVFALSNIEANERPRNRVCGSWVSRCGS